MCIRISKKKAAVLIVLFAGLILYIGMFADEYTTSQAVLENITNALGSKYSTNSSDEGESETMRLRRERVIDYCNQTSVKKNIHFYEVMRRLIIDRAHKIAWCPVCKAGSTVWMRIFAILGQELDSDVRLPNEQIQVSKLARKAYPYLGAARTFEYSNDSRKFLIVRHPFERLLSAFRDKIENIDKTYYRKKFSSHIIKWYRKDSDSRPTPKFEEFLLYIVNERAFDEHWRPYYMECAPCWIQYDTIIKMETFEDDMNYFLKLLNVTLIDDIVKKNMKENINPLGITNKKITREYFSKLSKKLLESIFEIYKKDFDLFDYSPNEYFLMTIND